MQPIEIQLRQLIEDAKAVATATTSIYDAVLARIAAKQAVDEQFFADFGHLLPPQNLRADQPHTTPPPIPADQWPTQGQPYNPALQAALRRDGT